MTGFHQKAQGLHKGASQLQTQKMHTSNKKITLKHKRKQSSTKVTIDPKPDKKGNTGEINMYGISSKEECTDKKKKIYISPSN